MLVILISNTGHFQSQQKASFTLILSTISIQKSLFSFRIFKMLCNLHGLVSMRVLYYFLLQINIFRWGFLFIICFPLLFYCKNQKASINSSLIKISSIAQPFEKRAVDLGTVISRVYYVVQFGTVFATYGFDESPNYQDFQVNNSFASCFRSKNNFLEFFFR